MKLAKNIAELKAVSQNLMHANLSITDGIYSILSDRDIKKEIQTLGPLPEKDLQLDTKALVDVLKETIKQLESRIDQNNQ